MGLFLEKVTQIFTRDWPKTKHQRCQSLHIGLAIARVAVCGTIGSFRVIAHVVISVCTSKVASLPTP